MGDERKWEWLDGKVENSDLRMAVREARDQLTGFKTEHVEKLWELINLIILEWRVSKEETPLKKKGKSDIRREFATSFGNKLDLIDEFVKCYHENHTPLVDLEKSTPLPSLYSVLILGEAEQGNATSALKAANHLTKSKTLISAIRVKEECKTINKSLRKFKKLRANQKKGGLAKAKNQCEAIITRNRKIIQLEEEY